MTERCLACHEEIAWLVGHDLGYHARKGRENCQSCHPDHAGRDFELVRFDEGSAEKFHHDDSGFPLEGKHASAACKDCHQSRYARSPAAKLSKRKNPGASWIGLERACVSCHADVHRGALGDDCRRCHDARTWKPASAFDHAKSDYPLTGKHAAVPCAKCHLAPSLALKAEASGRVEPLYKPLPHAECSACHADVHKGLLGPGCAKCHLTEAWVKVDTKAFDHDKTRYPLRGRHATVPCASCHDAAKAWGKKPRFGRCDDCHKDAHAGTATLEGRPVDCAPCHGVAGFRPSTYTVEQHASSAYPLDGKHRAVPCGSCHLKLPKGVRATSSGTAAVLIRPKHARCMDCHRDAHGGQLASRPDRGACEPCHAVVSWKPSTYTASQHATLKLALSGRHGKIDCAACHGAARKGLRPIPAPEKLGSAKVAVVLGETECTACHADPHGGRFEPRGARPRPEGCIGCHGADAFRPSKVDVALHREFGYPVEGAHRAISCDACHVESKPAPKRSSLLLDRGPAAPMTFVTKGRSCESCHLTPHGDQFASRVDGGACAPCHGETAWRPADRFDHQRDSAFPLDGAHIRVACGRCHVSRAGGDGISRAVYKPVPKACDQCHRKGGLSPLPVRRAAVSESPL